MNNVILQEDRLVRIETILDSLVILVIQLDTMVHELRERVASLERLVRVHDRR